MRKLSGGHPIIHSTATTEYKNWKAPRKTSIYIYIYFFSSAFQNRTASALNASAGFRCGGKVTSVTNPVETHSATPDGRHFSAISHFSWLIDSWPWTLLARFFRGFSSHGVETHPVTSSGCNFTEKRNPPTPITPPSIFLSAILLPIENGIQQHFGDIDLIRIRWTKSTIKSISNFPSSWSLWSDSFRTSSRDDVDLNSPRLSATVQRSKERRLEPIGCELASTNLWMD